MLAKDAHSQNTLGNDRGKILGKFLKKCKESRPEF